MLFPATGALKICHNSNFYVARFLVQPHIIYGTNSVRVRARVRSSESDGRVRGDDRVGLVAVVNDAFIVYIVCVR